jgi:hypothetical protein
MRAIFFVSDNFFQRAHDFEAFLTLNINSNA